MRFRSLDIVRIIRIAIFFSALGAAVIISLRYAPRFAELQRRLDDAQITLRSDDIALSEINRLQVERTILAARYARELGPNSQAMFIHDLAATVSRHAVTLLATDMTRDSVEATSPPSIRASSPYFVRRLRVELRGTYRNLLGAIADLSTGSDIVAVELPNLRREGGAVVASVPLTIYEPTSGLTEPPRRFGGR